MSTGESIESYGEEKFKNQLVEVTAKVLNKCHNGELYFLGRSMEHSYDFLMGAFDNIPTWKDRLHHVIISLRGACFGLEGLCDGNIEGFERQMKLHKLHPNNIIRRKHMTVIIDVIHGGGTLSCFIKCLIDYAKSCKLSVKDMLQKIAFVAIQQEHYFLQSKKVEIFDSLSCVNECGLGRNSFHILPVNDNFWIFCGEESSKKTSSYPSYYWGDDDYYEDMVEKHELKSHFDIHKLGLSCNEKLMYDYGKGEGKKHLVEHMRNAYSMRFTWFRSLVVALNGNKQKVHDSVNKVKFRKRSYQKKKKTNNKTNFSEWKPFHEVNKQKLKSNSNQSLHEQVN